MLFKGLAVYYACLIVVIAYVEHFDRRLPGNVFKIFNIIGKRMCLNECDNFPLCQSINYNRKQVLCELNKKANVTDLEFDDDFVFIRKDVKEMLDNRTQCNVTETKVTLKTNGQTCVRVLLICGSLIRGTTGGTMNIKSPGYGVKNYRNKDECIWTLTNTNTVNSSFCISQISFNADTNGSCTHHFLEIREGNDENGNKLGKYCGQNTTSILGSPNPNLYIRWMTDSFTMNLGFSLDYKITDCGGVLSKNNSIITSPNYPNKYPDNYACAWKINAPEGYHIKLDFEVFKIENDTSCKYDWVDILNGPLPTSPMDGRYCGIKFPPTILSVSNFIRVIFKTDSSRTYVGFKARYTFY